MRVLCLLFLVVFAGAVALFAFQNQQHVNLTFLTYTVEASVAAVAGVLYGLGMLSGWTVVGMLRRSLHRLTTADQRNRQYAPGH
jgi:uncharacterized membrane protein YciS (DUF1049 family)